MAPFRARHANTRHGPVPAKHRCRASRAKPCPTPQPRPGGSTGGRRATSRSPAGAARRCGLAWGGRCDALAGRLTTGGSEQPLRRAASKTTTFEFGGGQTEAVAPFRARHANTRHGPVPAKHRRRASRAKPCPTPQPRPGGSTGGRRATRQHQDRLPGERGPRRSAAPPTRRRQTLLHQDGAVGSGRAGCARRGGRRGDCTEPRRVLACLALNGATAAAWPLRGLARDKLPSPAKGLHLPQNRPAPLDTPPPRSSAGRRTIPKSQQRAGTSPRPTSRRKPPRFAGKRCDAPTTGAARCDPVHAPRSALHPATPPLAGGGLSGVATWHADCVPFSEFLTKRSASWCPRATCRPASAGAPPRVRCPAPQSFARHPAGPPER